MCCLTNKDISKFQNKTWDKIFRVYNAQTTAHRTPEQLRQKYDSLKKETRKYYAQLKQERLKTGGGCGGGPHIEHKFEIVYSKVHRLIKLSTDGHESNFDSDATFLGKLIFHQMQLCGRW